jgi:GT2 family glycosyltransferase/glycosyltransferase involved in cell wall biosynthesis
MISYVAPEGVQPSQAGSRPLLTTCQGGKIALDGALLSLWQHAQGRTLEEIAGSFQAEYASPQTIAAGLACLCEAGLLARRGVEAPVPPPLPFSTGPRVAAVIVSYNSREWLEECLPSLCAQTYAPLEIVVVDNGSHDGSLEWLESHYPEAKRLQIEKTLSLAGAINRGAALATEAAYLLMLNPDVRLERDAVAQMVTVAEADPGCAAAGAKLRFWWAPAFLNGLGNRVGPFSWGTDNALGHLDLGQFDAWEELPSACYAAALIRRSAWEQAGPADEGFPMYYEDSEWSYRARLLGYRIRAAPRAVVYHAFGGRVPGGGEERLSPRKLRNVVYGRLRFAAKLLGEAGPRFLRNYAAEDWISFTRCLVQRDWPSARAVAAGWLDFFKNLRDILRLSRALQGRRALSDEQLFALQRGMPATLSWRGLPELTWDLVLNYYSPLIHSGRTRPMPELEIPRRPHLLIASNDIVDEKMAGPGMRYLEMARALTGALDVTLAVPAETRLQFPDLRIVRYWEERPGSLQVLVENSDVALVANYMVEKFPFLHTTRTRLVVDLYDPTILENLHYYLHEPMDSQQALNRHGVSITNRLLRLGDFFICGNDRQRDFWLGFLAANERINPLTFAQDSELRALIDVVGVGFPDRPLEVGAPKFRGVHPHLPEASRIVLWGGGIWNWLDPLTLVRAWPQVIARHPQARLVFLGTRHPNPLVPEHEMARKTQALAEEIGEKDRTIVFFEWISYRDREALLNESSVGVALHPVHVETRYSIRTRVLDYLWARLPALVTAGDVTSEWVDGYQVGRVVSPFDVEAVARALNDILDRPKEAWAPAFDPLLERFRWSRVVKPLERYCLEGGYAPDRQQRAAPPAPAAQPYSGWARALYIWRTDGLKALLHRAWRHLQWRLSRP